MKKPWNIIDVPVYSLSTLTDGRCNMNICTYVTPISLKPKQYVLAVYHGTLTLDNLLSGSEAVLQILNHDHIGLINILGKKSGRYFNKENFLRERNLLSQWKGMPVIKGCNAYIKLDEIWNKETGGDHRLFCFKAITSKTIMETGILTLQDLITSKVIL